MQWYIGLDCTHPCFVFALQVSDKGDTLKSSPSLPTTIIAKRNFGQNIFLKNIELKFEYLKIAVFIFNFKYISYLFLVFVLLTLSE